MKAKLLRAIFGHDFSAFKKPETFRHEFFRKHLSLDDLEMVHNTMKESHFKLAGKKIDSAFLIGPAAAMDQPPLMLMAQMHGNEPAGLAGVLYVLALSSAGLLRQLVIAVIGNDLAANQYFDAWAGNPVARQETRDVFRRGIGKDGQPLPDMNRIPNNFRELDPATSHEAKRWQELDLIADNTIGILDIHTARGDMVCLTESSDNSLLMNSPIKNILEGLTEAIGAATDSSTFKTVAGVKPNIKYQFGIEAGTHEDDLSYRRAAEFTATLLYNIDVSEVPPPPREGKFYQYKVVGIIKFSDLKSSAKIPPGEMFYTAKVVDGKIQIYQYLEFESIYADQIVAISVPSGIELRSPSNFSCLFITKSAELYSDKAIGLYPVSTNEMATKFCYACEVKEIDI